MDDFFTLPDVIQNIILEYFSDGIKAYAKGHDIYHYTPDIIQYDPQWMVSLIDVLNTAFLTEECAKYHSLENLKWLYDNKDKFNEPIQKTFFRSQTFENAVQTGNSEIIKWLCDIRCGYNKYLLYNAVSHNNELDNIKILCEHKHTSRLIHTDDGYSFAAAAKKGDLDMMKYFLEKKLRFDENVFINAALNGNLKNMQWLLEKKFPFDSNVFTNATRSLENMKWLHENKFPFDEQVFTYAAMKGDLNTLQWLLENKFPYNSFVFNHALYCRENTVSILEWLLENKFPYDINTLNIVHIIHREKNVIEWLRNNLPFDDSTKTRLTDAISSKKRKIDK